MVICGAGGRGGGIRSADPRVQGADAVEAATSSVDRPSARSPFILGVATVLVDPGLVGVGAVT
jgi:hypothetical protein